MYNMDISIFGYKITLEMLILIGVVYLILVTHTVCGCCNFYAIMEGLENMSSSSTSTIGTGANASAIKDKLQAAATQILTDVSNNTLPTPTVTSSSVQSAISKKEGFVGSNTNYGESSLFSSTNEIPVNTATWFQPNLTVTSGQSPSQAVLDIVNRPSQSLPLPEGQLGLFDNMSFKPECCPNTYSNSSGCLCMSSQIYNSLITRAGNNVPYSEY
jgi:hypothetical protein